MEVTANLNRVEAIIHYQFSAPALGRSAIIAAHRDRYDSKNDTDGNRLLAMLGSNLLHTMLLLACYSNEAGQDERTRRDDAQKLCSEFASTKNLASIAVESGIHACVQRSPRQTSNVLPAEVLAKAIRAIICAVWIDSNGDLSKVNHVIHILSTYAKELSNTFLSKGLGNSQPQTAFIDPAVLSNTDTFTLPEFEHYNQDWDRLQIEDNIDNRAMEINSTMPNVDVAIHDNETSPLDTAARDETLRQPPTMHRVAVGQQGTALVAATNVVETADDLNAQYIVSKSTSEGTFPGSEIISASTDVANQPESTSLAQPKEKGAGRGRSVGRSCQVQLNCYIKADIEKCAKYNWPPQRLGEYLAAVDEAISRREAEDCATEARLFCVMVISWVSVVSLRDALAGYRRALSGDAESHLYVTSAPEIFKTIRKITGDTAYLVLVRRYHIMMLYKQCLNSDAAGVHDGILVYTGDEVSRPGNPLARSQTRVAEAMLEQIFPDIRSWEQSVQENCRKELKPIRQLGKRLYDLTLKLGLGSLALVMPSAESTFLDPSLTISDSRVLGMRETNLLRIVRVLDDVYDWIGPFLVEADKIVRSMFENEGVEAPRFALEGATDEEVTSKPSGSKELLKMLYAV